MKALLNNTLFYGDNLPVIRENIADESVDLIYLDPPFNSNASYNVLFKAPQGHRSQAQIEAFDDTWHWTDVAELAFDEVMQSGNSEAAEMLRAMRTFLRDNDLMAYLAMMAVRLLELRRVLKSTGSLYLHCDPAASHYLKLLLDSVMGAVNFRNEIIWKRTSAHSSARRYGPIHDVIFFYSKGEIYKWNKIYQPYSQEYLKLFFDQTDENGRRWKRTDLTGSGTRKGATGESWRGIDITAKGRHWAFPPAMLEKMDAEGRIHWPLKAGGMPRLKQYPEDIHGVLLQDIVDDIRPMHNLAAERLGYPTQKPLALLERFIEASSKPDDVVLDPFCGCGTTVHAAAKLNRRWIGIDITHLAVNLIQRRLKSAFPQIVFDVIGAPKDLDGARALAQADKYEFQKWVLSLLDAVPFKGGKKGGDRGIDGYIYFKPDGKKTEKAIVSVKGGAALNPAMVKDLIVTVEQEGAKMGVFVTLEPATKGMIAQAASAGLYVTEYGKFPKIQIVEIERLFEPVNPLQMPWQDTSAFRTTQRESTVKQSELDLD